ncbi:MAG: ATP-binding protein, partial [Bacteroidota bacterium]
MIKKPLLLVSLLLAPIFASQNIVDRYNKRVEEEGIVGRFKINSQGYIIFDGESSPSWAIDQQLDAIGLTKGYGTGGIDPFKIYTYDEWLRTSITKYFLEVRGHRNRWLIEQKSKGWKLGRNLLFYAKKWGGDDILKEIHEHEKKVSKRNEEWNFFFDNLVPKTFQALTNPKFALVVLLGTLILIGCPIVIWNFSKSLFRWLFVRRPTILGEKDSDIYGSFLKRLLWKYPSEPKVIANPELQKKLDALVTTNQLITKKNKQLKWYEKSRKTPYPHIMAYGKAGIGKTLFAKNLAKNSGMRFMYMTVADLSQMPEEEALRTLKDFFAYAKRFAPCVLIVDEADRLFDF